MSSYLALKLGYIYKQNTCTQRGAENSISVLSDVFSYLSRGNEKLYSLSVSRTINQLIMRVHKLRVEYKLALQERPKGAP